jgi:hypothetical protein
MSWIEKHLGLDGVDLAVHAAVTGLGVAIVNVMFGPTIATVLTFKILAGSLVLFAWRRHRSLRRRAADPVVGLTSGEMTAQRFEEMEQRLGELEAAQAKVLELEERLDFAERILATTEPAAVLTRGDRHG